MATRQRSPASALILPLVVLAACIAAGGWLWWESQPRPVEALPPKAEEGPVMIRDFGSGQLIEAGTAPKGPQIQPGTAARPDSEAPNADGEEGAEGETAPAAAPPPAETPAAAPAAGAGIVPDAGRWEEEIAAYERADREAPPAPGGVLLLGASNIRMWDSLATDFAGLAVINRGVGGCRMSELAEFAPRLMAAAKPALVVVSAGSNDIHSGAEPEEVAAAFQKLLGTLRRDHPSVPVLCLGILPAKSRWDERGRQERANDLLRAAIADAPAVAYLDVGGEFLGADGLPAPETFLDDDLHPSALGNAKRAGRMRPVIEALLEAARSHGGA